MQEASEKKDLVIIPFHDWRKSAQEGFRTRDVHFITSLERNPLVGKILVINRPCTWLEIRYKRYKPDVSGEKVLARGNFALTRVSSSTYVADFKSGDLLGQILKKHRWFIEQYQDESYLNFIGECAMHLKMNGPLLINQNLFAYKLAVKLNSANKLFDAWDNFLRFPAYKKLRREIHEAYSTLAKHVPNWTTNSLENKAVFKSEFSPESITVIKNGLKTDFLRPDLEVPGDMREIPRPIAGFGGKISYLLNTDLINYVIREHPDISFVFVGQILDRKKYNSIDKASNVYFLGDRHYSRYPAYVKSFDVCLVPYNILEGQHGGDSIKVYEYLLTGKKVIGTNGNGLQDLKDFVYVVESQEEFSEELRDMTNAKRRIDPDEFSWDTKSNKLLDILLNG